MAPTTAIAQFASGSCVPPPTSTPVGGAASCSQWHKVVTGDTCAKVAEQYDIDEQGFVELNPSLDADCKNLIKGYTYCATPCDGLTTSTSAPTDGPTNTGEHTYIKYEGDGTQGWPSIDDWLSYEDMVATHRASLKTACSYWQVKENTPEENDFLLKTIRQVAERSEVDSRFALALALQESHGCLRVPGTTGAHSNPGIYQSHQGLGTCNTNNLITAGNPGPGIGGRVFEECPTTKIEMMVIDGISGTQAGDGLMQIMRQEQSKQYSGAELWYRVARIYNSGRVAESGMLEDAASGTNAYVSDVANRLSGYIGESGFAQ